MNMSLPASGDIPELIWRDRGEEKYSGGNVCRGQSSSRAAPECTSEAVLFKRTSCVCVCVLINYL
jgi:hypothetical protein